MGLRANGNLVVRTVSGCDLLPISSSLVTNTVLFNASGTATTISVINAATSSFLVPNTIALNSRSAGVRLVTNLVIECIDPPAPPAQPADVPVVISEVLPVVLPEVLSAVPAEVLPVMPPEVPPVVLPEVMPAVPPEVLPVVPPEVPPVVLPEVLPAVPPEVLPVEIPAAPQAN
jgi:hypothetical protein